MTAKRWLAVFYLSAIALWIFFASCSTTKKIKSVEKVEEKLNAVVNSDSSSTVKIDSVSVKKDNTFFL